MAYNATKTTTVTAYSFVFDNGKIDTRYLNRSEYAGLKRSKEFKKHIVSHKKILEVTTVVKTKIF